LDNSEATDAILYAVRVKTILLATSINILIQKLSDVEHFCHLEPLSQMCGLAATGSMMISPNWPIPWEFKAAIRGRAEYDT
jgi:hypothetical protein